MFPIQGHFHRELLMLGTGKLAPELISGENVTDEGQPWDRRVPYKVTGLPSSHQEEGDGPLE